MTTLDLYDHVVVPLDGSDLALDAIGPARRLARLHRARLWLVTVDDGHDDVPARLAAGRAVAGGDVRTSVLDGPDPTVALGRFDDDHPDALLCLTTQGRRASAQVVLGSVAVEVVRHSTQAVVLVGPACDRSSTAPVRRLVVCLDATPAGEVVLPWATSWSHATGITLALLHVVYPLVPPDARIAPTREQLDELGYLASVARRLQAGGHDVIDHRIQHPHAARAIVERVGDLPGSLVAIAAGVRPPLTRALLGSTTDEVLRTTPAPLLVVSRPS